MGDKVTLRDEWERFLPAASLFPHVALQGPDWTVWRPDRPLEDDGLLIGVGLDPRDDDVCDWFDGFEPEPLIILDYESKHPGGGMTISWSLLPTEDGLGLILDDGDWQTGDPRVFYAAIQPAQSVDALMAVFVPMLSNDDAIGKVLGCEDQNIPHFGYGFGLSGLEDYIHVFDPLADLLPGILLRRTDPESLRGWLSDHAEKVDRHATHQELVQQFLAFVSVPK